MRRTLILLSCFLAFCQILFPSDSQSNTLGSPQTPAGKNAPASPVISSQAFLNTPIKNKQILILNSLQDGLPVPDMILNGIMDTLTKKGVSVSDIFAEHLDLGRNRDPEYRANIAALLQHKLAHKQVGLIIAIDQPALEFLAADAKDLFPDAPVLTIYVQKPDVRWKGKPRKIMDAFFQMDVAGTLRQATALFPKTRRLVVINGREDDIIPFMEVTAKALDSLPEKLHVEYTQTLSYEEMLRRIATLPPDTIAFLGPYFSDRTGRHFIPAEVAVAVARVANVPVFAQIDLHIRKGLMGGSVVISSTIGERAAEIALGYLHGKIVPTTQKTLFEIANVPLYNWAQLEHWDVSTSSLPANAIFFDRPPTLFGQYKAAVIYTTLAFVVLAGLILALILQNLHRRVAEKKSKENESSFRLLVEHAPDAIVLYDVDLDRFVDANPSAEKLLGCSYAELLQLSPQHFYPPQQPDQREVAESFAKHNEQVMRGEQVQFERAIHASDGRDLICETRLVRLPSDGRRLVRASFIDITEQKQNLKMIELDEARLESLLRISQYDYTNAQDLLDFALSEAIQLTQSKLGYLYYYDEHRQEFTLNSWSKEVTQECTIRESQAIYSLDETGVWGEAVRQRKPVMINDFQASHPLKKGYPEGHAPLHSFLTIPLFMRDAIVAVVGVANKASDYSEADIRQLTLMMDNVWKMAEQARTYLALLTAENKYRNLLESIQLLAVMLDADGNITFCNNYLLNMTGWTIGEVTGNNWFDLFIPEAERGSMKSLFSANLTDQSMKHYENVILTQNGCRRMIVWDNTLLYGPKGSLTGIASIGTDVTEHRHLEEQLRQSQKMEAIGQLAGGVAHDFNNILTVIMGYGNILKMNGALGTDERDAVEQIIASSEKAAQLTHGLLAFSRKQVLVPRQTDLNDILHHVQKFLFRVIGEDIQLKLILNAMRLPVNADSGQIEQVLINLATNARDAMPKGGVLTMESTLQEIDAPLEHAHGYGGPGRYACITVSDTGSGMDEETRSRVFEPFFTTKETGKGTGLGMAIVYGIVRQHNGFINVYSEPSHGTTFRVYIPSSESEQAAQEGTSLQAPPPGGSETILLAEDDAMVRKMVTTVLTKFGYQVIPAEDGQEAVEKFAANRDSIDMILMDMIMPKKNGKEAYDAISLLQPGVKVLYSSGYTADFIQNRGVSEAGIELIMKPVQPLELLRKVREMLDS